VVSGGWGRWGGKVEVKVIRWSEAKVKEII